MSEKDTPRIEVTVDAPFERVWDALRDPALVRCWHGWHFDGLDEEGRVIFEEPQSVDAEQHVVVVGGGDRFSLHRVDGGTVVRVTRAPLGTDPEWDAYYDDITEGWTTFLQQLRFGLERHELAERRTLVLDGALRDGGTLVGALGLSPVAGLDVGSPYRATLVTGELLEGQVWARTANQCVLTVDAWGDGLLVLAQQPRAAHRPDGGVLALLTMYEPSGDTAADVERRWTSWWLSVRAPEQPRDHAELPGSSA